MLTVRGVARILEKGGGGGRKDNVITCKVLGFMQ